MLKSLTDLSAESVKKAVSSAYDRMDGVVQRQMRRAAHADLVRQQLGNNPRAPQPVVGAFQMDPNGPPNGRIFELKPHKREQFERITVESENILSYGPDEKTSPGLYIGAKCLNFRSEQQCDYFEVEVLDTGSSGDIAIGLVPWNHPLDQLPGFIVGSVGYHAGDGKIYLGHQRGNAVASRCEAGDKIGCGVRLEKSMPHMNLAKFNKANLLPYISSMKIRAFFTLNGNEIASTLLAPQLIVRGGLYPAVALSSPGEEVKLILGAKYLPSVVPKSLSDESLMCVDSYEDDWQRLHDIRLNGDNLEYAGRGKSILDVGLAQARRPLDTRYHYFEIEIVHPGENCYIAIGLTKKDYPHNSHPGWNKGSIAYHADDGKLFMGSGAGDPFGPRCHRGDVMGCGIIFPRDFHQPAAARKGRRESCGEDDLVCQGSSSEDPTPSEFSSQSDPEDESFVDSDDSEGIYEARDANAWAMRPDDYRLLAIGRGFPVQFMQERRARRLPRKREADPNGPKVQVFFTRNGVIIGQKDVVIPSGGFFPTVGMLSSAEKVKVDLHPLTG